MDFAAQIKQAAAANPMPFTNTPAPVEGLVVHVDGDYCAYYCAGNDEKCDAGQARRNFLAKLDTVKRASGAQAVIVHLTDNASTKGERYLAATVKPYQGQRKKGSKPKNWETLREYMEGYEGDKYVTKMWRTREADDGIAYVAHHSAMHGKLAVISTADKDMRMLPGRHVVWLTSQFVDVPYGAFEVIGPENKVYGHKWFWMQMIQGDGADNIPGIPGRGENAAKSILKGVTCNEDARQIVAGEYRRKYAEEWPDRFVEQAALLWLRTDRYAELNDFLKLTPMGQSVDEAAQRMLLRVNSARAELEALK